VTCVYVRARMSAEVIAMLRTDARVVITVYDEDEDPHLYSIY